MSARDAIETASSHCRLDREAVRSVVRRCVARVLERDEATLATERTLVELGADSFNFVELVVMLERELSIALDRSYGIPDTQTIETFVDGAIAAMAANNGATVSVVEH